ncbi:MAG TPA: NAD-dependent epimerase/dehydratase family protein [Terriglobales bacterium]
MPTVLLTGAAGFTGRYLRNALEGRGYKVVPLQFEGPNPCDLTDRAATEAAVRDAQPDAVIHLAALSFVGHDHPEEFYRVNVFGTLNLLQALKGLDRSPQRVLVASSGNVYGTPDIEVLDESVCPAPVNHYANSKLAMEHMVRANWFSRLPIVITRPFNYTGVGQANHFLIPKIVQHFRERAKFIELGNLNVFRDFSDVDDVVAAYVALLESDARSEIVNICSGRGIALLEVVRIMNHLAGYEIEVRVNPEFVRENEVPRLVGSNERLRSLAKLPASRPFAETLKRMYEAQAES